MAVADVLETRISTRATKGQESQNYLKHAVADYDITGLRQR